MFLAFLTLITALTISAVAIYYSVAGLVAIFAAAAIPIIIMGGTLEIAKLVTAVWLHRYWNQAVWWLKTYLTTAVVVLMFITSMGIFGFLSKAHIEQTAASEEGVAQIERIDSEIARLEANIVRAEDKIESVQSQGTGADANIQAQIDREQARIDSAYERVQPLIDEQNAIIDSIVGLFQDQIDQIDNDLKRLQNFIDNDEIEKAQAMVGTAVDGDYGPNTAEAFTAYQERKAQERAALVQQVASLNNNPQVQAARQEIRRLRTQAEQQIARSNELIDRLRSQLGQGTGEDIDAVIDEQNLRIVQANERIDELTQEKFELEAKTRALEAEVGPIKYIAEFIYDDADKNMLEEAVRWVIIVIIFVFDPLAVGLLIASQYTFNWHRQNKPTDPAPASNTIPPDEPHISPKDSIVYPEPETLDADEYKEDNDVSQDDESHREDATEKDSLGQTATTEYDESQDADDEHDEEFHKSEPRMKSAMSAWKADNPQSSLKHQRRLLKQGVIDELPWIHYLEEDNEYDADPDAVEAAKWAQEQLEASKKKDSDLDRTGKQSASQETQELIKGYIQNAEQNHETIWRRTRDR